MSEKLTLYVDIAGDRNGFEMGVLNDGTPFLSMRALSRMCGIANSTLSQTSSNWLIGKKDGRLGRFLHESGISTDSLYIETQVDGKTVYAYPDDVCSLVLEFYAFEVNSPNEQAIKNYRTISRAGLRMFIYSSLGYDPGNRIPEAWRHYSERMLLNTVPPGYFSVFKEMGTLMVTAMQGGMPMDSKTVPDISVGKMWSKFWETNKLERRYGERSKHPHVYPDHFPQSQVETEAWIYPVGSLGEFRIWMNDNYLPHHFPKYVHYKAKRLALPASFAEMLIEAVAPKMLTDGSSLTDE